MSKFRDLQPLYTSIVEILSKRDGTITDVELYKVLEKSRRNLSFRELNEELMRLEVEGIIHVFTLMKNKKRIELRKV